MPRGSSFPLKPDGYKTPNQWAKEGRVPRDKSCIRKFVAVGYDGKPFVKDGHTQVFGYVAPEDTVLVEANKVAGTHACPPRYPERGAVLAFDTETTGFSPDKGEEILEISIADKDGPVYSTYVRPIRKESWDDAMAVHHITPEMVKDAPLPSQVAPIVQELFRDASLVIGHNVAFDVRFVERCLGIDLSGIRILDTCEAFKAYPHEGNNKLSTAVDLLVQDEALKAEYANGAHDALVDAKATIAVYYALESRGALPLSKAEDGEYEM